LKLDRTRLATHENNKSKLKNTAKWLERAISTGEGRDTTHLQSTGLVCDLFYE